MPRSTRSPVALLLACLALALLAACSTGQPKIDEYGDALKANFMADCQAETEVGGGTTTSIPLAQSGYCECVYNGIAPTEDAPQGQLPVDQLKEFEEQVAEANPGEPPAPPAALKKAMDECSAAAVGPAAPSTTEPQTSTTGASAG